MSSLATPSPSLPPSLCLHGLPEPCQPVRHLVCPLTVYTARRVTRLPTASPFHRVVRQCAGVAARRPATNTHYTLHCVMYATLNTKYCTLHTAHYILQRTYCTQHTGQYTLHTAYCILQTVQKCTLHTPPARQNYSEVIIGGHWELLSPREHRTQDTGHRTQDTYKNKKVH